MKNVNKKNNESSFFLKSNDSSSKMESSSYSWRSIVLQADGGLEEAFQLTQNKMARGLFWCLSVLVSGIFNGFFKIPRQRLGGFQA